jgi:site-specific DNA recombinase
MGQSTGREYLRVSVDRSGRTRSITEQHDDHERAAATRGVRLLKPYSETGSASRYATKTRDDFARLLADLRAGRFAADELWMWETSRGSRDVGEWLALIDACAAAGVLIYVSTHGRTYDARNSRDRRSLLEDAVDADYESSKTSDRAKRAARANAAEGKPHGRPPYGYVRRYDEHTRKLIAQEADPIEADAVRELFRRIKAGHSLRSIAADFAAAGTVNRSGTPFSAAHLRNLAVLPAYAALRSHRIDGQPAMLVAATWPALIDRADFDAVQRILSAPLRKTTRPGRAVYLLSGIAVCDVCELPLYVTVRRHDSLDYQCRKGCVRVAVGGDNGLDSRAEVIVLDYLARPDVAESMAAADVEGDDELQAVRAELAQARSRHDELAESLADGRISASLAAKSEPRMLAAIAALEARERELTAPHALAGLIEPGAGVRDRWQHVPMSARRMVARLLLSPDLIGELRVMRKAGARRVPVDVAERIRLHQG